MELACLRRVSGAGQVAGEEDRLALLLDHRIRDRNRREQGDCVRMERVVVQIVRWETSTITPRYITAMLVRDVADDGEVAR